MLSPDDAEDISNGLGLAVGVVPGAAVGGIIGWEFDWFPFFLFFILGAGFGVLAAAKVIKLVLVRSTQGWAANHLKARIGAVFFATAMLLGNLTEGRPLGTGLIVAAIFGYLFGLINVWKLTKEGGLHEAPFVSGADRIFSAIWGLLVGLCLGGFVGAALGVWDWSGTGPIAGIREWSGRGMLCGACFEFVFGAAGNVVQRGTLRARLRAKVRAYIRDTAIGMGLKAACVACGLVAWMAGGAKGQAIGIILWSSVLIGWFLLAKEPEEEPLEIDAAPLTEEEQQAQEEDAQAKAKEASDFRYYGLLFFIAGGIGALCSVGLRSWGLGLTAVEIIGTAITACLFIAGGLFREWDR